jgi:hypothetical protein
MHFGTYCGMDREGIASANVEALFSVWSVKRVTEYYCHS